MLYTESKQYLIDKLKAAGIKSKPFTTEKALEKSQESHIGAVLFERETFTRNGSKKRYRDEEGTLHKRRKIMERATTFGVIIGGYTDNEVEEIFDRFVASLDRGIYIDGNFVPIEIEGADWVDKDDSLLKAQVAVQVMITFNGGVYRDTGFAPLTDVRDVRGEDHMKGAYRWRLKHRSRKALPRRSLCRSTSSVSSTRLGVPPTRAYAPRMAGGPVRR